MDKADNACIVGFGKLIDLHIDSAEPNSRLHDPDTDHEIIRRHVIDGIDSHICLLCRND